MSNENSQSKIEALKSYGATHVPHLCTTVTPLSDTELETISSTMKTVLRESRAMLKTWSKEGNGGGGSSSGGSQLDKVMETIEALGDALDEEDRERMIQQAKENDNQVVSYVDKPPIFNWLHWIKDKSIPTSGPKRFGMLARIPVLRSCREELDDLERVPLFPLKDKDKKEFYYMMPCSLKTHYQASYSNDEDKVKCHSYNYTPKTKRTLGAGTPKEKVPALHKGVEDLTNYCAVCPKADHNNDWKEKDRCRKVRSMVVYLVGNIGDCRTDTRQGTKPAIAGPFLLDVSGVAFGTLVKTPSPFGRFPNKVEELSFYKMRYYKEMDGQLSSNNWEYVGNEDLDVPVVENMQSVEAVFADYIHDVGIGYHLERDALAKSMIKEQAELARKQRQQRIDDEQEEEEYRHPAEDDDYDDEEGYEDQIPDDDFEPELG